MISSYSSIHKFALIGLNLLFPMCFLYGQEINGGEIFTKESYLYGRFEVVMQSAEGDGIVSSFFLYNAEVNKHCRWPEENNEIDVEMTGNNQPLYVIDGIPLDNTNYGSAGTSGGFDLGDPDEEKILVGGGIGLVPLYMLAEKLVAHSKVRLLMGGRTRDDIITVTEFERLGVETYVSTEDGSLGEEGLVTQVLERKLDKYKKASVYACGPMPMIDAVQSICASRGTPLQVSLEALMACGVGACLGCVVKGAGHSDENPQYLCTCKQGPVFHAEQLDWNRLEERTTDCGGCA